MRRAAATGSASTCSGASGSKAMNDARGHRSGRASSTRLANLARRDRSVEPLQVEILCEFQSRATVLGPADGCREHLAFEQFDLHVDARRIDGKLDAVDQRERSIVDRGLRLTL
jgi:hypothetical protein